MTTRLYLITAVLTLGLVASVAAKPKITAPDVPANLVVPDGHELFLEGRAVGTQNYICMASAAGAAWKFLGPQATLFIATRSGHLQQQVTTHFLSANPMENGTARPSWQHSFDSSQVWARASASSTDPNYVVPGAIPWLLLEAVGGASGPGGGSVLGETSFIQRVNTNGGAAPATGCTQAAEIGVVALVPYTTDYYFYREAR